MNNLHGIVFAYRTNPALRELTMPRNTSSVPFGGRYRIIDFMLSNMVNAGVTDVGLVVHAGYQSLLDHVGSGKDWDLSRKHGGLRILPLSNCSGRMEALAEVRVYLDRIRQDYVILSSGEMAVNLDISPIYESHLKSGADITAVCSGRPWGAPPSCNYFTVGENGLISDVAIHPTAPLGAESMEIYIMSTELLLQLIDHCAAHGQPSFSHGVLSPMVSQLKVSPYFFNGYVARIQTVESYFSSSMDLLNSDIRDDLFNPARAIRTKDRSDPSTYYGPHAKSVNSLVADGCIVEGEVVNSILSRGVRVERGAKVSNCILMQSTVVRQDAVLSYIITDKNVQVSRGRMLMGYETYPLSIAKNAVI